MSIKGQENPAQKPNEIIPHQKLPKIEPISVRVKRLPYARQKWVRHLHSRVVQFFFEFFKTKHF